MRDKTLSKSRTARVVLGLPSGELELELEVTPGLSCADRLLPMARALTEKIVELTVIQVEEEGRKISCRAGCGACCRQLVPIGEAEARAVRDLVAALPEPRRSLVNARFAEALLRLDAAGLLTQLRSRADWDEARRREIGLAYFREGIPCPFLEEESCSIHPERPIACREYLVTSPPEHCADPRVDQVEGVKLPASVWTALARLDPVEPGARSIRWVPLILALEWAEAHPDEPPRQPAEEMVKRLFENIARKPAGPEACGHSQPGPQIEP
jgi:Fe-S-cluster containining protein